MAEIFKVKVNLAPEIMKNIFDISQSPYSLKNELILGSWKIYSVRYYVETAFYVMLESGTVFLLTLKSVNPLNFLSEKSQNIFLEAGLANFLKPTSHVLNIWFSGEYQTIIK